MFAMLMFLFALSFLTPAFAAKFLVIAGIVYGLLQALKKAFPGVGGWLAVGLNIALSIGGILVAVPADQLFTFQTLITLLTTVLAAAGIHGTVKSTITG